MDERRPRAITTEPLPAARLLSWEALRYGGTGWWLDAVLPRGPRAFLVAAVALPVAMWGIGFALTANRQHFLTTRDLQILAPFLALNLVCLRLCGSLFARGLDGALAGLGVDAAGQAAVRRGLFGPWSNLGALLAVGAFIARDTWMGVVPAANGLTAFTDPERWDFATLGARVHALQLAAWNLEWLAYGYLLWAQVWLLFSVTRAIRRTAFEPHLSRLLVRRSHRAFFALMSEAATLCFWFAIGNLIYVAWTGELFPRSPGRVTGVGSFVTEMSDLLSTAILFVVLVAGFFAYVSVLRSALTRTVNRLFAEAGDAALEALESPDEPGGTAEEQLARLRERTDASSGLLRAVVYQREVDALGKRSLNIMVVKALLPLGTVAARLLKSLDVLPF